MKQKERSFKEGFLYIDGEKIGKIESFDMHVKHNFPEPDGYALEYENTLENKSVYTCQLIMLPPSFFERVWVKIKGWFR